MLGIFFHKLSFSGAFSALFIFLKFHISSFVGAIHSPRVITAKKPELSVLPKEQRKKIEGEERERRIKR
jgi:hypothetical protein